ncbi:unnamed protein product [Ilex paraguariensis]|uniref:RIN4 pathogenic type III effector avirulence factor Avr cleavage site domain-containing protein n=1 Tax=Ilex paraguariensis TaxID=185542 RepID=A0ABC8R897_9AQUA
MAQRAHVPKFGNWDGEGDVPYTVYFEKARKGRSGGKIINPNDPQENPDLFPNVPSPDQAPPSGSNKTKPEEPIGRVGPTHERQVSIEDDNLGQFADSPASNDNMVRRTSGESTHQHQGGRGASSGRPARKSGGFEHSIDKSPLHPLYQAKIRGKGSGSPAREGKNSYDGGHGTPARSRLKPGTSGDESPDKGAAIPRFGGWDENDPSSAENYTHIFNRVREERQAGGFANTDANSYQDQNRRQNVNDDPKGCCFPCFGK